MLNGLIQKSFTAAWNGKIGILYPIVLHMMAGVLRLGMLFMVCALLVAVSEYPEVREAGAYWFVLFGLPVLFWWILSASCRLMWWHEMEKGSEQSHNTRVWLTDLPPMLCLDFFFAVVKVLCFAAVILGVVAMMMGNPLSILTVSVGALMALLCTVIQPLVIAERMVSGDSLIQSVINAFSDIRRFPAMTLAVRFLPEIVAMTLYMSAFVMGVLGSSFFLWALAIAGWIVSMIKPVFWNELVFLANPREVEATE